VNVLPEQKRPGNPEEVSELTREQIERLRPPSHLPPGVAIVSDELQNALCDLALRALAPPQIQEQAGETPRTNAVAMGFRRQTVGAVESAIEWAKELERELQAHQSGASSGSPDAVQEQRSGDLAGGNSGVIDQITATPQAGDLGSVPL
jgi:hypothetical protein